MAELEITIKGKSAEAIETIRRITGKHEPMDVIISAVRVYEWVLTQQAKGYTIVSECPDESRRKGLKVKDLELVNYIKDKDTALAVFKGRDVFF